tara:strand:- start:137 stop:739 length:603 start_codon:yes stop_codon:yes gene_type:complete
MAFATIDVTKGITGTIPVANGGTGLTSGTTGQFLKFTGTTTVASSAVDAGKVLQTQSITHNSRTTVSSGSFSGVGLEDTITCSAATSKVLVMVSAEYGCDSNNASVTYAGVKWKLFRNHSGISETEIFSTHSQHNRPENSGMDMIFQDNLNIIYLDSPNTTNEITYSVGAKNEPATTGVEMIAGGSNEFNKTITLIEIGA